MTELHLGTKHLVDMCDVVKYIYWLSFSNAHTRKEINFKISEIHMYITKTLKL